MDTDILKRERIIEYPELEEIHKKHLGQIQASPRISQRREGGNHLTALGLTSVPSAPCHPKGCWPLILPELESQFRVQPGGNFTAPSWVRSMKGQALVFLSHVKAPSLAAAGVI